MLLQFHYTEWHSHTTPFSNAILEFRRRVRSVVGNTLKSDRPMLVHCNDGGEESFVYDVEPEGRKFSVFKYISTCFHSHSINISGANRINSP